jgi:hypothetical protein
MVSLGSTVAANGMKKRPCCAHFSIAHLRT